MKRFFSLALCLLFMIAPLTTAVLAGGGCSVSLVVERNGAVKYNSADTYEISFAVQSDTVTLKGPQACCFAVDLTVFDLLYYNAEKLTNELTESYKSVGSKAIYTTAKLGRTEWSGSAYYAVSEDKKTAFVSLQPYQLSVAQDISSETKLESVLVGLKAGKSESDITDRSVRFMTVDEAQRLSQDVITLSDGSSVYSAGSISGGDSATVGYAVKWGFALSGGNASMPVTDRDTQNSEPVTVPDGDSEADGKWHNPFVDISESDGYYDAVRFVYEKKLFIGVSDTEFAPHRTMTRAMFVTVLGRLAQVDQAEYTGTSFDDAKAGEWYSAYVEWAAENGIVNGYGNGRFGVNDEVTVEQAAAIIARYARFTGISTDAAYLTGYGDIADISDWALDDMAWAVENGIYIGADGKLSPKTKAGRALVATMMYGYVLYTDK